MRSTIPSRRSPAPARTRLGRRASVLALLSLGLSCAATQAAPAPQRPALEEVLERVRTAVGSQDALGGRALTLDGHALALGIEAEGALTFAPGGAFVERVGGPLGSTTGFDGEVAWVTDYDGATRSLSLEERDATLFEQWVVSGHWLDPRSGIEIRTVEEESAGPRLSLRLAGTPTEGVLALDPATWLPATLVRATSAGEERWTFADWRDVGGLRLPFDVRSVDPGGNASGTRFTSWSPAPTFVQSPFARPVAGIGDTRFDPATDPVLDAQRTSTGHLLVHPLVDGEDVGWFIFDTGAGGMCIDRRAAEALGLAPLGTVLAVGVAGRETTGFRVAESFELGPLRYERPVFVELDLAFLEDLFGEEIGGIVGYDFFARAVVELDVADGVPRVFDPKRYELAGGEWLPLLLDGRTPNVPARFEGGEGVFRLDTGAGSGTVTFHTPTVRALGLLEGRALEEGVHGGVGGHAKSLAGHLAWFELGGHRVEDPLVEFATTEVGGLADRYTAGNLGQAFLRPFRLVLDYPNERFALVALAEERRG